jgi:hypothetical protein
MLGGGQYFQYRGKKEDKRRKKLELGGRVNDVTDSRPKVKSTLTLVKSMGYRFLRIIIARHVFTIFLSQLARARAAPPYDFFILSDSQPHNTCK